MPSLSEGRPNVVLEALGVGTPVIGSDVDGIAEVLSYKKLLFNLNDVDAMSDKIVDAVSSRENCQVYKKLCIGRREKFIFDWERRCIDEIERVRK